MKKKNKPKKPGGFKAYYILIFLTLILFIPVFIYSLKMINKKFN